MKASEIRDAVLAEFGYSQTLPCPLLWVDMIDAAILAALDAIREPSEAMIEAGFEAAAHAPGPSINQDWPAAITRILGAMIDALKREVTG